jgi:hypothetical protein
MGSSLQSHRTDGGAKRKTICIKEEKKRKKIGANSFENIFHFAISEDCAQISKRRAEVRRV